MYSVTSIISLYRYIHTHKGTSVQQCGDSQREGGGQRGHKWGRKEILLWAMDT